MGMTINVLTEISIVTENIIVTNDTFFFTFYIKLHNVLIFKGITVFYMLRGNKPLSVDITLLTESAAVWLQHAALIA